MARRSGISQGPPSLNLPGRTLEEPVECLIRLANAQGLIQNRQSERQGVDERGGEVLRILFGGYQRIGHQLIVPIFRVRCAALTCGYPEETDRR